MKQPELQDPSQAGDSGTPGAWHWFCHSGRGHCTYLKLLDTGAGVIGEALGV